MGSDQKHMFTKAGGKTSHTTLHTYTHTMEEVNTMAQVSSDCAGTSDLERRVQQQGRAAVEYIGLS
jgi:hypothetical protein